MQLVEQPRNTGGAHSFDERLIERYVMAPERLSAVERFAAERMIEQSEAARQLAAFFRSFYQELARLHEEHTAESAVDAFVDTLFPEERQEATRRARTIPLRSLSATSHEEVPPVTVLAAQTKRSHDHKVRFEALASLASREEEVVVRILCDHQLAECRLFTVARESTKRARVLISIPAFGLNLLTDAEGRLTFEPTPEVMAGDWSSVDALMRTSSEACVVDAEALDKGVQLVSGPDWPHIRAYYGDGCLKVVVDDEAPDRVAVNHGPRFVLVEVDDRQHLLTFDGRRAETALPERPETVRLRFYS